MISWAEIIILPIQTAISLANTDCSAAQ